MLVPAVARAQVLPSVALPTAGPVSGLEQQGLYVTAPVVLDGAPLFRIAALAKPIGDEIPIDTRVLLVENSLAQLIASDPDRHTTVYDPKTFHVAVDREGSQYAIEAADARHTTPLTIVTVTSNDARVNAMGEYGVAQQWQGILQHALTRALEKRQPQNIRENLGLVARGSAALIALTLVVVVVWLWLQRNARHLERVVQERQQNAERDRAQAPASAEVAEQRRRTLALLMRARGPEQRLHRSRTLASALLWGIALIWAAAITYALLLFPQTTAIGRFVMHAAGRIVFVWIIAGIVDRLAELSLVHFANAYARQGITSEERARRALRGPTITRAIGGFKTAVIFFIALLVTLSALQIPIASVVTIGGIAALAVGFAAQSLVRDMLNGLLVLVEDHYVVGDYVMIGEYNGIVENLTLRVVQLRDLRGYVITIPHSVVNQVVNASRNWARLDYRIAIDPKADLKLAIDTLRKTLEELEADDAWRDAIIDPVEWIGVEDVRNNGIVLRSVTKTAPLRQFDLHRVVNERVARAFDERGIALGADPVGSPTPAPNASPNPL